jgi:hypothetical protein
MTDEEFKQLEELAGKFEDAKDRGRVAKAIQSKMHPVFQDINDGGRAAANKDNEQKVASLTTERDQLKTRAEKAEGDLKDLDGKAPDATKLREKYEADLKAEREKHTRELQEKDQTAVNIRLDVAKQRLVDRLAAEGREVDREYAQTVLVQRPDVISRMQVDAKSPDVKVFKQGSTELHIVPAEGRDALDHLAEELAAVVPEKWKGSKVQRGSASNGGTGGGNGKTDRFDAARERGKDRTKGRKEAKDSGSGLERLGGRRA